MWDMWFCSSCEMSLESARLPTNNPGITWAMNIFQKFFFPFVYLLDNSQRDPFYPVALGNVWKCRYLLPPPQPKSSSHSFNKQLTKKHRWDISSHTFEIFNLSFKKITFTWWLFCSFIPQFVFKENIFANWFGSEQISQFAILPVIGKSLQLQFKLQQ